MPETWLSIEQFEADARNSNQSLWFVKDPQSSGGEGVFCYREQKDIRAKVGQLLQSSKSYLIQKEIDDLLLLDGRKFTMRVFVLYLGDRSIHVYNESLFKIQAKPYDCHSLDRAVHISHSNAKRRSSDHYTFFREMFDDICTIVRGTIESVAHNFNPIGEGGRYQLFGADFVCTNARRPYLIEINGYPNLAYRQDQDPDDHLIKKRMLGDFSNLTIRQKPGRFVKISS